MDDACGICFSRVYATRSGALGKKLRCGHAAHVWCWARWDRASIDARRSTTCPLCRGVQSVHSVTTVPPGEAWIAEMAAEFGLGATVSIAGAANHAQALAVIDACLGDGGGGNRIVVYRDGETDPRPIPFRFLARLRAGIAGRHT